MQEQKEMFPGPKLEDVLKPLMLDILTSKLCIIEPESPIVNLLIPVYQL